MNKDSNNIYFWIKSLKKGKEEEKMPFNLIKENWEILNRVLFYYIYL